MTRIFLDLRFDDRWIADSEDIHVEAENLAELDSSIRRELLKKGLKGNVEVEMELKVDPWYRQFHGHYFRRVVSFKL